MKILFLPQNIASMPSLTTESFNKKKNVMAKALVVTDHKYNEVNIDTIFLAESVSKRNPLKWIWHKLTFKRTVKKWIRWADVVHYNWLPIFSDARDLKFAYDEGKKIFVEWVGSDIRNPDLLIEINPHFTHAFKNGYEYASVESKEHSLKVQSMFAKYGAVPLLCAEMQLFLIKDLFPKFFFIYQRIDCKSFIPKYPSTENVKPLIIHSPSKIVTKGSNIILPLIEKLKKEYDFEFKILHDVSRAEVLEAMQRADIQIILGGYGMAAMEAMSFGKPVISCIMKEVFEIGLSMECPIVNCNPDNVEAELIRLITSPVLRNEIGKKSRAFVEKFHDVDIITDQLSTIYRNELAKN